MSSLGAPHILVEAARFRMAIEGIAPHLRPLGMQLFPHGACGDASLLFGAYLVDRGIAEFMYVCGERGSKADDSWTTHAWLQRGSLIVDLTADQFPDAPTGVIVAEPSLWHRQFATQPSQCSDFRQWRGYGAELLRPMYARIIQRLKQPI